MKYLSLVFLAFVAYGSMSMASAAESNTMCTMEYAPVCAQVEVQCVRAPCYPVHKTYSNLCMMNAEGAKILHPGACTAFEESTPVVLSQSLKYYLEMRFNRFALSIAPLEDAAELAKFKALDSRITTRLAVTPTLPMTLTQEMQYDKTKYALRFLQDLTKTSIWNLEEQITGKRYLFRDLAQCKDIQIKCMAGETLFTDEVGCGCKK